MVEGEEIRMISGEKSMKERGIGFLVYKEEGLCFGFTEKSKRERKYTYRCLVF